MGIDKMTDQIVDVPKKLFELGNISIITLLKETGYFERTYPVTEVDIFDAVNRNPASIDQWMQFSENKRTTNGWYFNRNGSNEYFVGLYPQKGIKPLKYDNAKEACANYILREIESWRD